jgi:hypothetical protein
VETQKYAKLLDQALKKFRSCRESIEAWKAHLLRSINLDWAMKFLRVKSREQQSEFFDKQCISWDISVIMINDEQ